MKNILFVAFVAILTLPAHAVIRGINKPDKVIKLKGQNCHVFSDFIVVEKISDQKGADRIAVRSLKNISPKAGCSSESLKGENVLDINSEYVYGVRGNFVFTQSADGFGQLNALKVYSINSPKSLQTLNYHIEKDLIVTDLKDSLALEFYSQLKLTCTLAQKGNECWERIKKENGIHKDHVVGKPDCDEVYAGHSFKTSPELKNNPDAVQVFALVKIPDVKAKGKEYLKSQATCDATP